MVLNNIEELLVKYENAETTLQEETQLNAYFTGNDVATHLEHYRPLFQYFTNTQKESYAKDVPLKTNHRSMYQWISVAAVTILMLGIMIPKMNFGQTTLADYTPDEQKMYLETKNALAMLSSNFSEGTSSFNVLGIASDNFNKGIQNAGYLTEFGKTTNKFLK
jgi:hypothetical protein